MRTFLAYFINYIFRSKTKQPLLFIAVAGLILSSFALLFLQATMGGLQHNLIERSKKVHGHGVITFKYKSKDDLLELYNVLKEQDIEYGTELTLELLIKSYERYAPVIAHGLEKDHPKFAFTDYAIDEELLLGGDLSVKLGLAPGEQVRLMSPAHVDPFMGNIPRMATFFVGDIVTTNVPEVDSSEAWAPLLRLQALIGERKVNVVRIFSEYDHSKLKQAMAGKKFEDYTLKSWEDIHATLVWALNLETTVMVFLFSCMCLLVSLSITSGLMLFFDKIKRDLVSFWILGKDEESIYRALKRLLAVMVTSSVLIGLVLSTAALFLLDRYGEELMPDVFVDQKIPVYFSLKIVLISFFVPLTISFIFSWFAVRSFRKDIRYLDYVTVL